MQRDTFSYLVANPVELTAPDVVYLEELVEHYPFCQLSYTLLAKAAAQKANDEVAAQALRKAAAYALSRNALRKLLNGEFPPRLALGVDGTLPRKYVRSDEPKVAVPPTPSAQDVDPVQALRGLDYSDVLLAEEEEQAGTVPASSEPTTDPLLARQQQQLSIIDRFIQADSKMGPIRAKKGTETEAEPEDLTAKQPSFGGGLVTEAFAKILEKQGKFDKARETYEKLSLKFPEKKAYFAEKIEALKNT